ncbi:MAG: hypothetical protein ACI4JK_00470 [Oscillospiraceae bacterium]
MYKKQMTNIPSEIVGAISRKLEPIGIHPVHIAYGSMLENDESVITVLVRENKEKSFEAYGVVDFDCKAGVLQRWTDAMSYPDALIAMGNRIKE